MLVFRWVTRDAQIIIFFFFVFFPPIYLKCTQGVGDSAVKNTEEPKLDSQHPYLAAHI